MNHFLFVSPRLFYAIAIHIVRHIRLQSGTIVSDLAESHTDVRESDTAIHTLL